VREFLASVGLAGVSMRLAPGGMRELHWHPNADEWQYYIEGMAEMTVFLAQGQAVTEQFAAGYVGYVPMGAGHYIKNTGPGVCRLLLGFKSGHYQVIDLSAWLASNPQALVAGNFSIPAELAKKLPTGDLFMVP
jgi:oxalate decarboxylase